MKNIIIGLVALSSISALASVTGPQATCLEAIQLSQIVGSNSKYKNFDAGVQFCRDIEQKGQAECMKLTAPYYYGLENLKEWCQDATVEEAVCISFGVSTTETFTTAKEKCKNL